MTRAASSLALAATYRADSASPAASFESRACEPGRHAEARMANLRVVRVQLAQVAGEVSSWTRV